MTEAETPPVVRLVDETGAPAPDARVEIFATPPLDATDTSYRSQRVAVANVLVDGTVDFPAVPVRDLRRFANEGYVNLEFDAAERGGSITSWSYSVELPESAEVVSLEPSAEDLDAPASTAAAGRKKGRTVRPTVVNGQMTLRPHVNSRRLASSSWPCNETRLIKTYKPWVTLAVVRSDHKKVSGSYELRSTKDRSVSSRLGVAVDNGGGLELGGRVTVSTTWDVSFGPWANTSKQYETKWLYGTFRTKRCLRGVDNWKFFDKTQPIENLKDIRVVQPGPYSALKCRRTAPSQNEHTDSQRNVEWGGGVQLAAKGFAVDLSAQTGFSEVDTVAFHWAKDYKGRGYFCGQFAVPTNDNHDLVGSVLGR